MTESLRARVVEVFNNLKYIVEKDPKTFVGMPTLAVLRELLTAAKDAGGDAALCDAMLNALPSGSSPQTIAAADALVIAGQLMKIVRASQPGIS